MDFYRIDEKYCKFLQEYEKEKRGLTKVPNIRYTDRNKFAFGAVMQIHNINYYVSVSSFDKKQEANILIRVPGDKKEIKGSLRFNYMIPVPEECIEKLIIREVEDEKYQQLLDKEYQFCKKNALQIQKKAKKIYASLIRIRRLEQDLIAVYKPQLLLRYLLDILLGLHVYAVFLKLFGTFFFLRNLRLQIFLTN